jgi:hypothetical protein
VTAVTMDVSAELSDGVNEQLVWQLVDRARAEGLKLTGEGSLLAQLTMPLERSHRADHGRLNTRDGIDYPRLNQAWVISLGRPTKTVVAT